MPEPFLVEYHRIGEDLGSHVLARVLRVDAVGVVPGAGHLGAAQIGGQITAAVRGNHLQSGKTVQGPVENHPREEERGLQRIADDVAQSARSRESPGLNDVVGTVGMHEDRHSKFLRLRPEGVVFLRGNRFAPGVALDGRAAVPQFIDRVVQLLGRHFGKLQRGRAQRDKTVRVGRAPCSEFLVVNADDLAREIGLGRVPPVTVDAERRHIDALRIQCREPLGTEDPVEVGIGHARAFNQRRHLEEIAMVVNVDDRHRAPTNSDFLARLSERLKACAHEHRSSRQPSSRFQKIASIHYSLPGIRNAAARYPVPRPCG